MQQVVAQHGDDPAGSVLEALVLGVVAAELGRDGVLDPRVVAHLNRPQKSDFVPEAGIQAADRRPGAQHHLGDGHLLESALADEGLGGIEDALERFLTAPLFGRLVVHGRSARHAMPSSAELVRALERV